ncbi:MAG: hypothetical protein WA687_00480 [Solirubrobacterales bacterium]
MRLIAAISNRIRSLGPAEDGYTMIATVGAVALISTLAAAALAATNGDINLVQRDLDRKQAHAAAQAGIADYSFHLNNNNGYWTDCDEVDEPNAVNQVGSTERRRKLSGGGSEYAIELLPANDAEECDPEAPGATMLEQEGTVAGSFRIRSTGFAGDAQVSLIATYKRTSLLDFIYFTQLETSDPVTYTDSDTVAHAKVQCVKFRREGRESVNLNDYGAPCRRIVFVTGDEIRGPLHTNDDLAICGTPKFGRGPTDVIEVTAPPQGWIDGGCSSPSGASPVFNGPLVTTADKLEPPPTNAKLKDIAGASYTFKCVTTIELNGDEMEIDSRSFDGTKPFPPSGVIYIDNGSSSSCSGWSSCPAAYSPFTASYSTSTKCGTAMVKGDYESDLTIAAANDIIVMDDLEQTEDGQGILGLIANNFVRVWHPCGSGNVGLTIDAAILSIDHSFIVDHYDCGSSLGTLTVNGAISQKFRGPVGTTGGTGYIKNYNYDDRLRYMEPPSFLDPIKPSWHIERETLDFPDVFG